MVFDETHFHEATLSLHMHAWIFSHLSIASVDGKQHLIEVVFSDFSDLYCKETDGTTGAAHLIQTFFSDISWYQESKDPCEPQEFGFSPKTLNQVRGMCWSIVVLSFSLQWKFDKNTKLYLTQMLLSINWWYWKVGKNSRIHMKVHGCLMQVHFIEIHEVCTKKE